MTFFYAFVSLFYAAVGWLNELYYAFLPLSIDKDFFLDKDGCVFVLRAVWTNVWFKGLTEFFFGRPLFLIWDSSFESTKRDWNVSSLIAASSTTELLFLSFLTPYVFLSFLLLPVSIMGSSSFVSFLGLPLFFIVKTYSDGGATCI